MWICWGGFASRAPSATGPRLVPNNNWRCTGPCSGAKLGAVAILAERPAWSSRTSRPFHAAGRLGVGHGAGRKDANARASCTAPFARTDSSVKARPCRYYAGLRWAAEWPQFGGDDGSRHAS